MKKSQRKENLLPGDIPKYIRCFDSGDKFADRYTVIFTHADKFGMQGRTVGIGMSSNPFHPQGVGMHFDYAAHECNGKSGLGKRIKFSDLSPECQRVVKSDYMDYWSLKD